MQHKINRILSLLLVLVMVLSMVPTVFAAEDSVSVTYVAENTATGVQYADINAAIAEAQAGQTVKVLADAQDVAYGNEGVILDLNGHDLSNVTVSEGVTLSAIDSATDDCEGDYGSLTTDGTVATTVKTTGEVKSYVTIAENGSYSFHRYYAAIAAISLKPAQVALGYRAEFRGDEAVKNAVVSYGYELWLNDGAHKTYSRTDALEKSSLTLRLKNIMAEGNNALNALGSTATIGGNAFITLNLGGEDVTLYGTEQETTLRQVVESVNASAASYGEAQLEQVRAMCTTYASWMEGWATDAIFGNGEGEGDDTGLDVEITVDVIAENNILTQDATLSNDDITVTVPQGTVLENGTTQLVLTITEKASTDSNVSEEEGYTLLPLDVHIQGISVDNTTPIIVCLGEVLPKGLNIGNYELYHVESGETIEMTRVYSVEELDTHNEFYYDPATGAVTVAMASFSEITLRSTAAKWTGKADPTWYDANATTLYIYNADQLWSFSQIVGGMAEGIEQDSFAGKTVVLYADIDLNDLNSENGYVFYPIGYYNNTGSFEKTAGGSVSSGFYSFAGIFDGNGHTISNFYQNTWEMFGDYNDGYSGTPNHYRDGMGLFGKVYGGTVKNLTVKNFSSDGEFTTTGTIAAYADNGATFENIAIFNCNPRVYNIGNGGIVGCVGWYNNETEDKTPVTFRNITVDNTNKISALWGSYDVACGGLVGQYYPTSGQTPAIDNAGIRMENCHVAAQIDVYNDVCGNYMYYAYRYAGMLIGSVRKNVTGDDGRVYPKMDGITADGCTVHYGEWNHYYYCEFESNGHPSYAQPDEYKFSRVPESELVRDSEGNVTGCTHDHSKVEDNRAVYLPFYDQLVTGYGWGVTSKGIADIEGVTVLDRVIADSVEKFVAVENVETEYTAGAVISIGDLFKAAQTDVEIDVDAVQVFVSPVDKENSTVSGTYAANTSDWTKGILVLTGAGDATITITDYNYCKETVLNVTVTSASAGDQAYVKVTEAPANWSGEYLIVYEDGNVAFNGGLTTLDAVSNTISVTISNNAIDATNTTNAAAFTIDSNGYIKSTSGYYIGQTTNDNGLASNETTTYTNTLSVNKDGFIDIVSSEAYLRYNASSGQTRFRYYKSTSYANQKAIALYKLGSAGESCTHDDAEIVVTAPTCEATGSVIITCDCGYTVTETIAQLDHSYVDGNCEFCGTAEPSPYVATDIGKITAEKNVIITMTDTEGNTYALYNGNGTSDAPTAISVHVMNGEIVTSDASILWNIVNDGESLTIYPTGTTETWLYCNNINNGVRVGTGDAKHFTIKDEYLYTTETDDARYIGVYNKQDWRCYTSINNNIIGQTLTFYMQKVSCAHANTTEVAAVAATCGSVGYTAGTWCNDCETYTKGHELIAVTGEHSLDNGTVTMPATCGGAGVKTYSCTNCDYSETKEIPATGEHTFTDGACSVCGEDDPAVTAVLATFEFGDNGDASHKDGSELGTNTSYSDGDYSLDLTGMTKVFGPAYDATGNSCIKLGTSSAAGEFSFTVPDNVTKVVIHVAGYTKNTASVTVNGETFSITTLSNDGAYTEIAVDTTSTKTVSFAVTTNKRVMINTIEYYGTANGGNEGGTTEPAVVLEITASDFNSISYDANNNTKTEGDYSYTSNQVMQQSNTMQWQKSKGYITISSNEFTKLELEFTAGTFTVTVGGTTVTGTTADGVTTYDLSGLTGEVKISVGSAIGKVDSLKFYK